MAFAYDELYIDTAQRIMGDMYDYAVNTLDIEMKQFQDMFLVSHVSKQIERGNPSYVAGINGCEAAKKVIESCTGKRPREEDAMYVDKSPEYWTGWALCYYQWQSGARFKEIEARIPVTEIVRMYPVYHEMDILQFVQTVDMRFASYSKESQLKRLRMYAKLSQKKLSEKSGVAIRQIQLFEQGQRDIQKTQGQTLKALAHALNCNIEDLLD